MKLSDQRDCAKRLFSHIENRTTAMAADKAVHFAAAYTSSARLADEKENLLRKYPFFVGFSSDVADPGDFITDSFVGVPVLILRDKDGQVRAYLNMCAHRAAPVADGCGKGVRGFVCPYHGWVYNIDGSLINLPGKAGFEPIDKSQLGLQPLPVQEKYGLIWLSLTPGADFEIDSHLDGVASDFAHYGYEPYVHYRTEILTREMNWKLVMDTFLENYHLSTLHKNTIADQIMNYVQLADPLGDNIRLIQARKSFREMMALPEEQWDFCKHTAIAYLLFPNTLFIHQSDHVEIWRSFPDGDNPGSCKIYFDFYVPEAAETDKARRYWDKNFDYGVSIVLDEDFVLGQKIQKAFESGRRKSVTFGRNESGLIAYHASIARALGEAPDVLGESSDAA